jgi:hypothetical protein
MYELVLRLAAGTSTPPPKAACDSVMPETSELRKQVRVGSLITPTAMHHHALRKWPLRPPVA